MADTEGLDKSTAKDKTNNNNDRGAAHETTGSTEDFKASFHPDMDNRFATASAKAAAAPADKPVEKEKPLTNQVSGTTTITKVVIAFTILIAIAALVGVAYLLNEYRVEKAKLAFENTSLQADLDAQKSQVAALQSTLSNLQERMQDTNNSLGNMQSGTRMLDGRLSAIEGQIAEMTGSQRIDWMLKEVEHFVMVAERRLSLLGDVDGALALLFEADQLVREMAEPAARPLRKAIQEDLYSLQQASESSVDTEGLFAKLALLRDRLPQLKTAAVNYEMKLAINETDPAVPDAGWRYALYEVEQFFRSLVRVQRVTDEEIKPLLLQDQQAFVEQNIKLLLEQAQMALLRGNQSIYRASLAEAENRVKGYLRTDTTEATAFLKSLRELNRATVEPTVPSITESVRAVQVFSDFWQQEKVERQLQRAAIEAEKKQADITDSQSSEAN